MTTIEWRLYGGEAVADTVELGPAIARPGDVDLVSVLVPVATPGDDLTSLYESHIAALEESGHPFEFVFITSPAARPRTRILSEISARGEQKTLRIIESTQLWDEAALLKRGLRSALGTIIVILPPAQQVEANAVATLVGQIDAGYDMAIARRWPRLDPALNRAQSWLLHRLLGDLCDGQFHDVGCGVRAIRRRVLSDVPLYGEFPRFLPLLAKHQGFAVREVNVRQHPSDRALRLHGPRVWLQRMLDVLGLVFLLRFTDRPLRFFGPLGMFLATMGAVTLLVLVVQRLQGTPLSTRPLLLFAVLSFALGLQAIAFGLIGEMIVHYNARDRRSYRVRESDNGPPRERA